mgnify:CR=1 FL=1
MTLVLGIISIIVALFFLYRTVRLWPPGVYRPYMTRPSTVAEVIAGLILVAAASATGVILISGGTWLWVFLVVGGGLVWALITAQ